MSDAALTVSSQTRNRIRNAITPPHPQSGFLVEILTGETNVSSSGFPYISDKSFHTFTQRVPHLFRSGAAILDWLQVLNTELGTMTGLPASEVESIHRAISVLRTVIFTAGVTAPPDLWLFKPVLYVHRE